MEILELKCIVIHVKNVKPCRRGFRQNARKERIMPVGSLTENVSSLEGFKKELTILARNTLSELFSKILQLRT